MKRFFTILFLFSALALSSRALLYKGAEGDDVEKLQKELYSAGYYGGVRDGKYTEQVCEAVKAYQRDNGIFPDGICTYEIARSLGVDIKYDQKDGDAVKIARLLCRVCKNDDKLTKLAVASVAVIRVDSPLFPDDMSSVINTLGGAFPCEISEDCMRAAYEALLGARPYGNILYYEETDGKNKDKNSAVHGRFVYMK